MKPDIPSLEEITAIVDLALKNQCEQGSIAREYILIASLHHFESCKAWIEWGAKNWNIGRRHMFTKKHAALFARRELDMTISAEEREIVRQCRTDETVMEILNAIPTGMLVSFASLHKINQMDRAELRDAVDKYLASKGLRKPKPQEPDGEQSDFFEELGLPPPDRFTSMLQERLDEVDFDSAAIYGSELMKAALRKREKVSTETASALDSIVYQLVLMVSDNEAKKFIARMAREVAE